MIAWVAGSLAAVTVVGLAVVSQGYEARELPRLETSVWVSRDSGRYARVNTTLGEIDTVRSVEAPTAIAQSGGDGILFGQGNGSVWAIDPAVPADLVSADESSAAESAAGVPVAEPASTPAGTRDVVVAGDRILLVTDLGAVFLGSVRSAADGDPSFARLDPFAVGAGESADPGAPAAAYAAAAAAVSAAGDAVMYSTDEGAVRRFDAVRGDFVGGTVAVPSAPTGAGIAMTMVGERWAMLQASRGLLWIEGLDAPVEVPVDADALLQAPGPARDAVVIADTAGLVEVSLDGAVGDRVATAGVPARPTPLGDTVVAAWLGVASGAMWRSDAPGLVSLETEPEVLADLDELTPVIRTNGDRAVLNETGSGMLWTIPDGVLIPVSAWGTDEDEPVAEGSTTVDDASEQEPPVATDDAFGVRAGALVSLPILLNDSDPNRRDVLTVVAASLGPLGDPAFGDLALVGGDQTATLLVHASSGSTTFRYQVSDGVATSPPATVTVTVVPDDVNTAPEWCAVEQCTQVWPTPEIAPGGAITVPVLDGWVDAEGDAFVLADVEVIDGAAAIDAVAMADGRVAVRHRDPNGASGEATVLLTVQDAVGATAQRELVIRITPTPALSLRTTAIVGVVGESSRLELADVVVGGSGSYRLTEAVDATSDNSSLSVVPNAADGAVELASTVPGEFTIAYTVVDTMTSTERTGTARFSVQPASSRAAVAPLTAFVRPGEDTTVGVLESVQNATGRVLALASATSDRPELSAVVVDQTSVRVRGATSDGAPGLLGTVSFVATDGAGTAVEGRITVFVAPVERSIAPIALPDSITVRAGAQVDIPVLANDVATRGELLAVHPSVVGSGTDGELAFSGGDVVRYLAPTTPGVYTVGYSVFPASSPDLIASSTITVTVLPAGANRPPSPRTLTARVIAGKTVEIPIDAVGIDPDGDAVVLVEVDQPATGFGTTGIAVSGGVIRYRAPDDGVLGGQVSFAYTVRDGAGATATGRVRIAVIAEDLADLTPVTSTNHVRAQAGTSSSVLVEPLLDDRDPAQGRLEIVGLEPNVAGGPGDPEFDRLAALVADGTDLGQGLVSLLPGDVVGTHSYVYTVRSSVTTSTAQGLIVVTVGAAPAPDAPIVTDTVLGIADRAQLEPGVDVVSGHVQWASGDPAALELTVWGADAERWSVSGGRISGPVPADGALVPFRLTGVDDGGQEVVAYGFLRIPAFDDMRVQTLADIEATVVDEEATVGIDLVDVLALGPGDRIEVRGDTTFPVQRSAALCRSTGGSTIEYVAGREAPWTDVCAVAVRVVGQRAWSMVSVPISVIPEEPRAMLQSIGRTIAPGATDVVDLYADMTSWESGRVGDRALLDYRVVGPGSAFVLTRDGDRLLLQAKAGAPPGTKETIRITVSSFGGLSASITLTVGVAPVDAPRGAGVVRTCTVTDASCVIPVVGLAGEYDPFAGRPGGGLRVVGVGDGAAGSAVCDVATVRVSSDSTLTATWPSEPKPVGGTCQLAFTVVDAQGRRGVGQLVLDVRGYPQTPASVRTVAYSATTATVEVDLGTAVRAQPAVTGVVIAEGGIARPATCAPSGATAYRCLLDGLVNGQQHLVTARAVNAVGESADTAPVATWSYLAPQITSLAAAPVAVSGRTTASTGVVELSIAAAADALSFRVLETGTTIPRTGAVTTARIDLPAGATATVRVVPISRFAPPTGGGPDGATATVSVLVAGAAVFPAGGSVVTSDDGTSAVLTLPAVSANGSTLPTSTIWVASMSDTVVCGMDAGGAATVTGGTGLRTSTSPTVTGLTPNTAYVFLACGANGFGAGRSTVVPADTWVDPSSPTGATYSIAPDPTGNGATWTWDAVSVSGIAPPADAVVRFTVDGVVGDGVLDAADFVPGVVPVIVAEYCRTTSTGVRCGAPAPMEPAPGSAPTTMSVDFPTVCPADGSVPEVAVSGSATGRADIAVVSTTDPVAGTVLHEYQLTWIGAFSSLTAPPPASITCPTP